MSALKLLAGATAGPALPAPAELLDAITVGVAVVTAGDFALLGSNARFDEWFPAPAAGTDALPARVPALDVARLGERAGRRRTYQLELEVPTTPRATVIRIDVLPLGAALLLVEAHPITRQKEAEYMLESYSRLMERQARDLEHARQRAERLLLNIMPREIAAELREFGTTTPQSFEAATVLMLDFVGFTEMAIAHEPGPLIAELNDVFTSFDRIMEHCGAERIKTIGDAYMAVSGVPAVDPDHELKIARAALRMRRFLERRNHSAANRWQCRIGLGSGPVIGSIVGIQKYVYDIFGPAVNLAARLEAVAEPMQILMPAAMAARLRDDFVLSHAGTFELKGFGPQEVWSLEDEARKGR
jgi:adenylate cyclase